MSPWARPVCRVAGCHAELPWSPPLAQSDLLCTQAMCTQPHPVHPLPCPGAACDEARALHARPQPLLGEGGGGAPSSVGSAAEAAKARARLAKLSLGHEA